MIVAGLRVDQNDFVPLFAQCLARLGAGIVELAGLTDDDRARANNKNTVDIVATWQGRGQGSEVRSQRFVHYEAPSY